MIDVESVINELVEHIESALDVDSDYVDCVRTDLLQTVVGLLKEQDTVEPKQVDLYGKDEWWGLVCICPDCKAEWMSDKADTHFYPKCGQAVKWE